MSEHNDIYRIIESLDAAQKSVKQLPALFKPAQTSPQLSGPYPGRNATRGYLVGEGDESVNPMVQAVHRRIAFTRPEWIVKYGVDAIEYAIEEIVGDDWDGEEIGSSDVSGYIRMIGDYLRDRAGSREEMADRKPFAEDKDEEDSDEQDDESGFVGSRDWESEDDEWDPSESEYRFQQSRRRQKKGYVPEGSAEKYSYRVTFDDGTHSNVAIPLSKIFQGDNSAKDLITQHFARKGRTVKEIEMMFPPKQGVSEGNEDTVYPGAEIIRARNGRPIGEIYRDNTGTWGYFHYRADHGADGLDSREDAMEELKLLHVETGRGHPDYTIKGEVNEGRDTATEDVLSSIKKKLGDYLQDVATAIKKDPDLKDKIPQSIDKISAVKTIRTDDGHEIKIHGNEDDGFRVTIRNRDLNTKFKNLDEATMACEMYCARRRQQRENADYIEEKR